MNMYDLPLAVYSNMIPLDSYLVYVHILTRNPRTSGSNQLHSLNTTPPRQHAALLNYHIYDSNLSIATRLVHLTRMARRIAA
jgi:hypothetical protein